MKNSIKIFLFSALTKNQSDPGSLFSHRSCQLAFVLLLFPQRIGTLSLHQLIQKTNLRNCENLNTLYLFHTIDMFIYIEEFLHLHLEAQAKVTHVELQHYYRHFANHL